MRQLIVLVLLLLVSVPAHAAEETGLRVWVRDLDDHGVAGVQLSIVDDQKQGRDVLTDAQGVALVAPLPGSAVRIVRATDPHGQVLLMDENDRDGGLRIPLQTGAIQALDLRLTDGLLFVEPVAEPVDPVVSQAPAATMTSTGAMIANAASSSAAGGVAVPTPADIAQQSQWSWLRWLVIGVMLCVVLIAVVWQAVTILRARRVA